MFRSGSMINRSRNYHTLEWRGAKSAGNHEWTPMERLGGGVMGSLILLFHLQLLLLGERRRSRNRRVFPRARVSERAGLKGRRVLDVGGSESRFRPLKSCSSVF